MEESKREGKIIILSAPSGSGKSTVIKQLLTRSDLKLGFSVSATSRAPRGEEKHGVEYYFLTPAEFEEKVQKGEFAEWEEVYPGCRYGTLFSEIERVTEKEGADLIMDIDVKGGVNLKKKFADRAISIFLMPPSLKELECRLRSRATDSEDQIEKRLAKAEYEIGFAPRFDFEVVNDDLEKAVEEVAAIILG